MDSKALKKLKDGRIVGVWLAVVLLASACGPPSAHQLGQACQASSDAQSAECAGYWGKGQQHQSAALAAKGVPPSAGLGTMGPGGLMGTGGPLGTGGIQSRRNGR